VVFESSKLQLRYVTKTRFAQLPGFSDVMIAIRRIFVGEKNGINFLLSLMNRPKREINKNLAIANRSRVSCAHNTLSASIGINITP